MHIKHIQFIYGFLAFQRCFPWEIVVVLKGLRVGGPEGTKFCVVTAGRCWLVVWLSLEWESWILIWTFFSFLLPPPSSPP